MLSAEKLRLSILQEAIQGRLVPQLEEEPAVEMDGIAPEEAPFAIPGKWKWVSVQDIMDDISINCHVQSPILWSLCIYARHNRLTDYIMYRHFFKYPVLALSVLLASGTAARGQESAYGILHIDKSRTEKVSPVRYGLHYEEIGMMGEGALHAELVRNRSFEEANPPEGLSVRSGLYENIPAPKAPAHEVFECDPLAGWTTLPLSWSPIYISRTQEYGMKGIAIDPYLARIPADHAKYYPIYAKCCELDIPIVITTGPATLVRDAVMDDVAQAQYGYIAMPVFVVGLLAGFIYNPIIASLADDWAEGRRDAFARRFAQQVLIIVGITLVCIAGAWLIGVPVLSLLYNTELAPYKADLLVLLAGGGFLAMASLFTTGLTIIRWQGRLIPGYVAVSALAFVACPFAVGAAGIDGASWVYLGLMAILTVWFGIIFALGVRRG